MYSATILMYMGISALTLILHNNYIDTWVLFKSTIITSIKGNLFFFVLGFIVRFNIDHVERVFEFSESNLISAVQLVLLFTFTYLSFLPPTMIFTYISSEFIGGLEILANTFVSLVLNIVYIFCFMSTIANITFHEEYDVTYYTGVAADPFRNYFCTFVASCLILLISNMIIGDIMYTDTIKMSLYLSFLMITSSFAYAILIKSYKEIFN